LLPARRPGPRPDEDTPRSLRRRLAALPGPEQHRLLLDLLRVHTAAVLGHGSTDGVDTTVGFLEAGFDSLTAVELRNQLTTATGLRLPTTLLFDHPTPALLAEHLRARILDDGTGGAADQGGTAGDPGGAGASAASPPVLAALSRLEPALATVATDSTVRTAVITRLRDVLAAWTAADEPGPDGVDVADRLRAATAEEVFDFIDNQIQI
ncbi:phosphopantetheine-binding protein, partial [Frankia sp. CiP1_Cm_nod1]|uniref:phosphopantetheine-binding protein n=1 Tax=Frankia sp. CiP1_Cm_nod1 TaxID=2897160 RepID=UPI0020250670